MAKAKKKYIENSELIALITMLNETATEVHSNQYKYDAFKMINILTSIKLDSDNYDRNKLDVACRKLLINSNDNSAVKFTVKMIRSIFNK